MLYQPIESALDSVFAAEYPEARRLFHGRGHMHDGLEHINIDWYPPVLLITAYEEIQSLQELKEIITAADRCQQIKSIVLQKRFTRGAPSEILAGNEISTCHVNEGGLAFEIHPGVQQNAGLFLDMRPLREWLQKYSEGKNVLNLFAYTCSLSVAALAGDARQVVNVDMSKPSIKWGERNHALNNQDMRSVRSIPHNLFRSWGRIKKFGPYDTILIDPPTRQRGSFDAEKDYAAVLKKLNQLTKPGASIIATVNSPYLGPDFLKNHVQRYAPHCSFVGEMPASPEFEDKFPDKALKIYHFRVHGSG
jgi:23S rRNA (cytosine1962-C5)-methyltransferase